MKIYSLYQAANIQNNSLKYRIAIKKYLPWVNAKFPIVAKTIIPHRIQVRASTKTTIRVSRKIGPWNLLYDANEIKSPKAIPIELKTWAAAYTQT